VTIHVNKPGYSEQPTRTQATSYYESLANRLESQTRAGVPRSQGAWGAEQARLGSWNTGVGQLRAPGVGSAFTNGEARPAFSFDPEEVERPSR